MRPTNTGRVRLLRVVGAAVALALIGAVLRIADPSAVWRLLRYSHPMWLAAAAGLALLTALIRGVCLSLLLPPTHLGPVQATVVAAAAKAAALFVPARAGELALPWLLRRVTSLNSAKGVSILLAVRALDVSTLGAWVVTGATIVWGLRQPVALVGAFAMLLFPVFLPTLVAAVDRLAVRFLAPHGVRARRWTRHVIRLRLSLQDVRRSPRRLVSAAVLSYLMWGGVWAYTWCLLTAMGYRWPADKVIAGSAAAGLSNALPINLIANLGTLEAGWTAAFVALGFPLQDAAASGLAAHLWGLTFAAVLGGIAWVVILCRETRCQSRQRNAKYRERA